MCKVTKSSHAVFYNCETSSKAPFWIHRDKNSSIKSLPRGHWFWLRTVYDCLFVGCPNHLRYSEVLSLIIAVWWKKGLLKILIKHTTTETGTSIQNELTEKYEAFYYVFGILKYGSLSTVNICITL